MYRERARERERERQEKQVRKEGQNKKPDDERRYARCEPASDRGENRKEEEKRDSVSHTNHFYSLAYVQSLWELWEKTCE